MPCKNFLQTLGLFPKTLFPTASYWVMHSSIVMWSLPSIVTMRPPVDVPTMKSKTSHGRGSSARSPSSFNVQKMRFRTCRLGGSGHVFAYPWVLVVSPRQYSAPLRPWQFLSSINHCLILLIARNALLIRVHDIIPGRDIFANRTRTWLTERA